ncbi:ligand-binding sensor domain-containing protein, partial [Flavihumibacter solisilvae]
GVGEISIGKITGITQDPQGYMWFTDQDKGCITRFDGYSMVSFKHDPSNSNSLGGTYPECIVAEPSGILWIGFFGGMGLDRFDPFYGTFTHFRHNPTDPGSLISDSVCSVIVDRDGDIWVGTMAGLDLLDKKTGKFIHFRNDPKNPASISSNRVRTVYEDRKGTIWVACGPFWEPGNAGGLNRLDKSTRSFTRYMHEPGNPNSLADNRVRAILEDSKGNFWIGTSGDGLHTLDRSTGKFTRHSYDPANPAKLSRPALHNEIDHITFITEDGTGCIWIGTFESGVSRYDPEKKSITRFGNSLQFADNTGWWAYTSREGVLWFSTQEANLYRIDPFNKRFSFWEMGMAITNFFEEPNGELMVCFPEGIFHVNATKKVIGKEMLFPRPIGMVRTIEMKIIPDRKDFLVSNGGQLFRYNKQTGYSKILKTGISGRINTIEMFILTMIPMDEEKIWLGTEMGVYEMDLLSEKVTKIPIHDSLTGGFLPVSCLYKDSKNTIWAGSGLQSGLFAYEKSIGFRRKLSSQYITTIFEDSNKFLWVGTTNGLFSKHRDAEEFSRFKLPGSPIDNALILGIVEDDQKHLWISSRSGLFRLDNSRSKITWYGGSQGLKSTAFTQGILKLNNGDILVGTTSGYYAFQPDKMASNAIPPQIVLRDLKVKDRLVTPGKNSPIQLPLEFTSEVRLKHNQNFISIGFAGIHFNNPGENQHYYMLEGFDRNWRSAVSERTAYYYNIPPGNYTFRVKASNNDEVWNEKSLRFVVIPAWYSTPYFLVPAVVMLTLSLYALVRWRIHNSYKKQLEHSETEKQLSELKHRSAMLEMQALRSQMNPHFIFNSLNSINRFILHNDKAKASEYLTKFSRLMRLILQHSEHSSVSLENELQALSLYLELEAVRFDHQFDYRIIVDEDIDVSVVKVPPLIFQPYAENAIWHGLMHKEEKGLLEVVISQENNLLICKIRDNGIGRQQATELNSKSASQHKSMGMKITAGRIEMIKANSSGHAHVTIRDLVLADGSAGGTEVIIKIPVIYD